MGIFKSNAYLQQQLQEKRPLPVGVQEFHDWSDRIIAAAGLPSTIQSQKYVLANVICNNCSPADGFQSDAYFISYLRKDAANAIADQMRRDIYAERKQSQAAASASQGADGQTADKQSS